MSVYYNCSRNSEVVFRTQSDTVVTREYPAAWERGLEPYYPIDDEKNNALFARYMELARRRGDVFFGSRLGEYKYYDMHDMVVAAQNRLNACCGYDCAVVITRLDFHFGRIMVHGSVRAI